MGEALTALRSLGIPAAGIAWISADSGAATMMSSAVQITFRYLITRCHG